MKPEEEAEAARKEELRMIVEMIEASMALAVKKGKHPLTNGCGCIVCAERRKQLIRGTEPEWKYWL
jgi:hypothetical protein